MPLPTKNKTLIENLEKRINLLEKNNHKDKEK